MLISTCKELLKDPGKRVLVIRSKECKGCKEHLLFSEGLALLEETYFKVKNPKEIDNF